MLPSQSYGLMLFSASSLMLVTYFRRTKSAKFIAQSLSSKSTSSQSISKYWLEHDHHNQFLEEVLGEKALNWVKDQNQKCISKLKNPEDNPMYSRVLGILESKDKIPYVTKIGDYYYNFWQDASHVKGILRKTTFDSYRSSTPEWITVIDIDKLGQDEKENWVYKGYTLLDPLSENEEPSRILLNLSRGGADATVIREFDLLTLQFFNTTSQQGYTLPEAKSRVAWKTKDILLVGTDIHDGSSLTDSGYPRVVREWTRGTKIENAPIVFEGEKTDVAVGAYVSRHCGYFIQVFYRSMTFYTAQYTIQLLSGPSPDKGFPPNSITNQPVKLLLPEDAKINQFANQLLISLRTPWTVNNVTYSGGSLLAVNLVTFLNEQQNNSSNISFQVLYQPTSRSSLDDYTRTQHYLILNILDNVKNKMIFWKYDNRSNKWSFVSEETEAVVRGCSVGALDDDKSDYYWLTTNSFVQPSTLSLGNAITGATGIRTAEKLKQLPIQFNNTGLVETQGTAISADGTPIPYFIIHKANMTYDGNTPTLLYGYGGFEVSLTPNYAPIVGSCWLERGGCYVSANIRGGGEFGPSWHQAALKQYRKLAYDDFIAVAEDLIQKKITSPSRLGIRGGSNGGLLMGNMITRRPDLFGAVCCAVPLLDMYRYHTLLAGASWMAEYGDPTKDWEFLQNYSAYHNIDPVEAKNYPPLLMTTSTRDDRVHPYHARAFSKRLLDCTSTCSINEKMENKGENIERGDVYYYENIEGGHGGAADNKQQAYMNVLYLEFLWRTIGR